MVGSPAPASQLCLSLHRPSRRNLGEAPRTPFKFQGKETRGLDSESSVKYLRFAHGRTALREARVRGGNSRDEDGGSCPSDGDREGGGGVLVTTRQGRGRLAPVAIPFAWLASWSNARKNRIRYSRHRVVAAADRETVQHSTRVPTRSGKGPRGTQHGHACDYFPPVRAYCKRQSDSNNLRIQTMH